jgi:hypothetical protein
LSFEKEKPVSRLFLLIRKELGRENPSQTYYHPRIVCSKNHSMYTRLEVVPFLKQPSERIPESLLKPLVTCRDEELRKTCSK